MCLAVPGKIIRKKGKKVIVDYGTQRREAHLAEAGYNIGDYVIVQAKIVVQKVPEKEALESIKLWKKVTS